MDSHAPCPRCRRDNPAENLFCGRCGTPLTSGDAPGELVPRRRGSSVTTAIGRALPANLGPVGRVLAMGAAALVAEACLSRLGRRAYRGQPSPQGLTRRGEAATSGRLVAGGLEEILVLLGEGDARGRRVFGRRAVRWYYAVENTDPRS